MKATVEDEKLQSKINDEDKVKILDKCNEVINGLDKNQIAGKEEYEHQQKAEQSLPLHHYKLYQCSRLLPGAAGDFSGGGAEELLLAGLPQSPPLERLIKPTQVQK
ncbi:Heat shock cognate 71 kDa protein [Sciurus carolinensis]|uniref:Heat shock cognate 71 kDa protein n=1 Tax=Sciurus carolinensis TaxID=30640 RepID=A0AA41MNH3_SCICA|nr:Heat shock cognate 71 kDa protein [Sciurus carolinensis]